MGAISQTTFSIAFFLNENVWFPIKISLKFVPNGLIDNIPALVQIISWRRSGDKPLSEPMLVSLLMHICVDQPQWVKIWTTIYWNYLFSTNMESVCRATGYVKNISFTTFQFTSKHKIFPTHGLQRTYHRSKMCFGNQRLTTARQVNLYSNHN